MSRTWLDTSTSFSIKKEEDRSILNSTKITLAFAAPHLQIQKYFTGALYELKHIKVKELVFKTHTEKQTAENPKSRPPTHRLVPQPLYHTASRHPSPS